MRTIPLSQWNGNSPADAIRVVVGATLVTIYQTGDALPAQPISPTFVRPLTPRQFWQAVTAVGLRQAVEAIKRALQAAIAAGTATTEQFNLNGWIEKSQEFERGNPVLAAMAAQLGKTDSDIDALFALGAAL